MPYALMGTMCMVHTKTLGLICLVNGQLTCRKYEEHVMLFLRYRISSTVRQSFSFQNSPKNLDPSFKTAETIQGPQLIICRMNWPGGYKTFFMLNSVEHEILKLISVKISRNSAFFLGSDKPRMLFSRS